MITENIEEQRGTNCTALKASEKDIWSNPSVSILIVEDDLVLSAIIAELLKDEGAECVQAANAEDTLKALENSPSIRVMITDIDIAGNVDGLALSTLVRDRWPLIEILLTSGNPLPVFEEVPSGVTFLQKPFRYSVLLEKLQVLVRAA